MTVTFDNNVLLSATLWEGSVSQKLLFDLIRQDIKIYSSEEIINDYKKVLKRDFKYSDEEIIKIVKTVQSFITLIQVKQKLNIVKDDPDDNMILECAIESGSKYIITYDKHLLKLNEFKTIRIIRPEEARAIF
jgi:putative PIN family toxin of toxin-antitoxin system